MSLRTFPRFLISAFCAATLFASAPDAIAAPTSYTVTSTDGVKLAVQESGDPNGPSIILVHGLLGSRLNWDAQVQSPGLRQYRIITICVATVCRISRPARSHITTETVGGTTSPR